MKNSRWLAALVLVSVGGCLADGKPLESQVPPGVPPPPVEQLAAPGPLTAVEQSATDINLTWTVPDLGPTGIQPEGYEIERGPNEQSFALIHTTDANAQSFDDSNLQPDTKYFYRVRAKKGTNFSGYSNVASATTKKVTTTPPPPPPTLQVPTGLSAVEQDSASIKLTWTDTNSAPTGVEEDGYEIERGPDGQTFALINTTIADATTFVDTGLQANTKYYYRARAKKGTDFSGYSNVASATTKQLTPVGPFAKNYVIPTTKEEAVSVSSTGDGGSILAVQQNAGLNSLLVAAKMKNTGDVEWMKKASLETYTTISQVVPAGNDYIVVGTAVSTPAPAYGYVIRLNAQGTLVWAKKIQGNSGETTRLRAVAADTDGSVVCVGSTDSGNGGLIVKLASDGSLTWSKTLGGTLGEHLNSVVRSADGGFIFLGGSTIGGTTLDTIIVGKINNLGALQWSKNLNGPTLKSLGNIHTTSDGGIALCATIAWNVTPAGPQRMLLAKLDGTGTLTWAKQFGLFENENAQGFGVLSNGNFVVAGDYLTNNEQHGLLISLTPQGDIAWGRKLAGTGLDAFMSTDRCSDGGLLAFGHSTSFSGSSADDVLLFKLPADGTLAGATSLSSINPTAAALTLQQAPATQPLQPGTYTVNTLTPTIQDVTPPPTVANIP